MGPPGVVPGMPDDSEYEVCKRRGHESDGATYTSNPPQFKCKWCGSFFSLSTSRLVEHEDRKNVNLDEYEHCQRRGHEYDGRGITEGTGPTWGYCRWCGVKFRFTEPELIESA